MSGRPGEGVACRGPRSAERYSTQPPSARAESELTRVDDELTVACTRVALAARGIASRCLPA